MSFMQATSQVWPSVVSSQPWPSKGVSYTYEHRGYVRPEKLEYWLRETFGHGASKYVVFNSRIYIKAPRKPTEVRTPLSHTLLPSSAPSEHAGQLRWIEPWVFEGQTSADQIFPP